MKLTTKQDIEAPLAFAFQALSDFEAWERSAMRRGAEVSRTDKLRQPGPGMGWLTQFRYRGKDRTMTIRLDEIDVPSRLTFSGMSAIVEGQVAVDLVELTAKRTRLHVTLNIKPKSLGAKLYVQALKLARRRVDRSYAQRIAQFATEIEDRFRNTKP